jgi:hypothetical protein
MFRNSFDTITSASAAMTALSNESAEIAISDISSRLKMDATSDGLKQLGA